MNFTYGKVDTVKWRRKFALLPETLILKEGGFVTIWLEAYDIRDIDCAVAEVVLADGRKAKHYTGH